MSVGEKLTKKHKNLKKTLKLRIYIYIPLTLILALLSKADDNPIWIGNGFRDWIGSGLGIYMNFGPGRSWYH